MSDEATKASRDLDARLQKDGKKMREEVKLLLIGPGESGKSTIFKQMKVIQENGGFSQEDLQSYKYIVYGNCITQMKVLVTAASKLNIEFASDENRKRADRLQKAPMFGDSWTTEMGEDIKQLWADSGIKKTYSFRDREYQLNDSAVYFFDNIERFLSPSYLPTKDDVLRARVRSTGIEEAVFTFSDLSFRMVDVGGQRSERRKWIHCFGDVTAILFCVALSEYDQTLREEDTMNRMKESLLLFDEVCNSHWFRNTTFIVFFNKTDLFAEKIKTIDLKICFENYTGGNNFDAASNFIQARFLEQNQSPHAIYTHMTCAIDTQNIDFIFKSIRETILKKIINDVMMY